MCGTFRQTFVLLKPVVVVGAFAPRVGVWVPVVGVFWFYVVVVVVPCVIPMGAPAGAPYGPPSVAPFSGCIQGPIRIRMGRVVGFPEKTFERRRSLVLRLNQEML